jgi:hypothetical protein
MAGNDIDAIIDEYTRRYGPLISVAQAAEISRRKVQTVYDWSSRGLLDAFKVKRGGVLLLSVAGFVRYLFDD